MNAVPIHERAEKAPVGGKEAWRANVAGIRVQRIPDRCVDHVRLDPEPARGGELHHVVECREVQRKPVHVGEACAFLHRDVVPDLVGLGQSPVELDPDALNTAGHHRVELLSEVNPGRRGESRLVDHHADEALRDALGLAGREGSGGSETEGDAPQRRSA